MSGRVGKAPPGIDGNWIFAGVTLRYLIAWALVVTIVHAKPPQTRGASESFEVASIRENRSGERIMLFQPGRGGRFTATNCPVSLLISYAYDVMQSEIAGAPAWIRSNRYDVAAKAESDPPVEGIRAMLQRLLEERFQLKSHWEVREGAVYDLVVSKPGKLKEASGDCPGILSDPASRTNPPPDDAPCGGLRNTLGHTKGYRLTAEQLAGSLSFFMQRLVVDKTGLTGKYDIELEWTPEAALVRPSEAPNAGPPSIFTAVREQLGLRLESGRGPVKLLVINHIERPSEN
jgi:uncharacterized protein (TIGR03435 family)